VEGPYPTNYTFLTTASGLTIEGNCNQGGNTANAPNVPVTYTTTKTTANSNARCGTNVLMAANRTCIVTVNTNGAVTYTEGN
jgi:hypothetical protein